MKQILIAMTTAVVFFSCKGNTADNTASAVGDAKQVTIDSINAINTAKKEAVDSMKATRVHHHEYNNAPAYNNSTANNSNSAANAPAAAPEKKGWSHTAKGAVVGAGAGAITGALVNKDHLKGAAIGTLIGGGIGAGTGAIVDHSKKKKAAAAANGQQ